MAYTHTFEFSLDGIRAEGDINFDLKDPEIRVEGDTEMTLSERQKVEQIFERLMKCHRELGHINKIEVLPID
jgi:hypothetical protein